MSTTLPQLPAQQAQVRATATALRFEGQHTSYAALHQQAGHMAAMLAEQGVGVGERVVRAFHARGVPVCNVYGSTETGPFSIALPPAYAVSHAASCGWPARSPGVQVKAKVVNTQAGVGEICIRAPNVATRYWPDQPLRDAEGFFSNQ